MAKKKRPQKKPKAERFILDGSVALAWCFSDEADLYADAIAKRFPDVEAVVPVLWHLEVANALLMGERRGRCDETDIANWTAFLGSLPITVSEQDGTRVFNDILALARAQKLTSYDAAYLELAIRLGLPLATLDGNLRAAAENAGVKPFTP
jgi:predicted nucleic acid-binding protein